MYTLKDIENYEERLNSFNYEKVRKTMEALNWTWFDSNGTPTEQQMRECIEELALCCLRTYDETLEENTCGSGGFNIRLKKVSGKIRIIIEFIVTGSLWW